MPPTPSEPTRDSASTAGAGTAAVRARPKPRGFCSLPLTRPRQFGPNVNPGRASLILESAKKWANGTKLRYHFLDGPAPWVGPEPQQKIVRDAFQEWTSVGIGLKFEETSSRDEAEIRIGFLQGDGSWSYIGRDILNIGRDARTMNFGWNLTGEIDTAIHEIGHTLGFPHEHQNPHAGIVWDEEKVYAALAGPPNFWPREETFHNIISKITPDRVQGSSWDANSVMHYPFEPGLILAPEQFRTGIQPAGGLSARDREWVKTFYPPLAAADYTELKVAQSAPLSLAPGQQANFVFKPTASRNYEIRTFGTSDTVMVLFQRDSSGNERFLAGDDDSGEDRNAYLLRRLLAGNTYVVRVRMYYADRQGDTAVMLW